MSHIVCTYAFITIDAKIQAPQELDLVSSMLVILNQIHESLKYTLIFNSIALLHICNTFDKAKINSLQYVKVLKLYRF